MDSRTEIARGWDLFHLGAFAEAESLLSNRTRDDEAVHLLLWIALRRGDAESKCRYGALLGESLDPNLSAFGRAHENVALATLNLSMKPWLSADSKWARSEIAYAHALSAFMRGSEADIRTELAAAVPQNAEQRVRYSQLRAWAKALGDNFEDQAVHLLHALTRALDEKVDRALVAIIAGSLALILREVELGELGARADELLERVEWPEDATTYRFYAQRALAWRKAAHGEWIPAMHLLDATLAVAPDSLRRGLIFADRARVSRAIGECVGAASSCAAAIECFVGTDWDRARDDEAIGVMSSMDVLAADSERVRPLFERVSTIQVSKMIGDGHGKRFDAFRHFAISYLADSQEALRHAQVAYGLFKGMKFVHRATKCALRAVEVGGGARWKIRVERLILPYPRSLAALQYERMQAPINQIRGRRREVVNLLVGTDKTAKEIGEMLGMAEGTVRVHIKHINKILNVENRAQLVRRYGAAGSAA
jgi:DNA-binding CsgD family transcriptional regulator